MRTFKFYLPALFVMLFAASAPALAQQGARRNTTVTTRQETRAERKQEKVNEVQKPANVASQSATDSRMRTAGGSQSDRRSGSAASSGGYSASSSGSVHGGTSSGKAGSAGSGHGQGSVGGGSGKSGGSSASGIGGTGSKSGSSSSEIVARPPAGGNSGSYSGGSYSGSGYPGGNRPPVSGSYPGYGYDNRPPVPPAGTYPGGYSYPGVRPPLPTVRTYDRAETVYRTNCSSIVLRTLFRTKEEAYRYVEALLRGSDYTIGTYGNGYSWLQSDVTFIPTPFDWTNPMTHNQFRIKVSFFRSFGYVKATISGEWRESVLSSIFSTLRFQPSSSYSTYYAWNVLEDLADAIPHTALSYR